jgi:hypothetical protein
MATILTQNPLVTFRSTAKIGIASANRDQSPIRSSCPPLANFALEAHALGGLKRRDDAALDLLSALPGVLAS